jgi:hypothetical protein
LLRLKRAIHVNGGNNNVSAVAAMNSNLKIGLQSQLATVVPFPKSEADAIVGEFANKKKGEKFRYVYCKYITISQK